MRSVPRGVDGSSKYLGSCTDRISLSTTSNPYSRFRGDPKVVTRVFRAIHANLQCEKQIIDNLWRHVAESGYLKQLGFPHEAQSYSNWAPRSMPENIFLNGTCSDDDQTCFLNTTAATKHCYLMPSGMTDGYHAMMHHYSDALLKNFIRDISFQLTYLADHGIAHGDLKLSNILVMVWEKKNYVFVLCDFWDAFNVDEYGQVIQLNPSKRDVMTGGESMWHVRKLQRWKFFHEKFGTRIYKDPELLETIRDLVQKRKVNSDESNYWFHRPVDAGAINMWSFILTLLYTTGNRKKLAACQNKIKNDILRSDDGMPQGADAVLSAMDEIRREMNKVAPERGAFSTFKNHFQGGNSSDKVDFRSMVFLKTADLLTKSEDRPTPKQLLKLLGLQHTGGPRNINDDLAPCTDRSRCDL